MNEHPYLIGMKFDVIIFNFPHAGHYSGLRDPDSVLINHVTETKFTCTEVKFVPGLLILLCS